jgi:hypothetical protein
MSIIALITSNKILTVCSSGNPSLVFTTIFHYKSAFVHIFNVNIDWFGSIFVKFLNRMFEISHAMPITQLIVFLHFEMYHTICVNMFYPMFTHVWNFTYSTTYIFNCLSPYWKVPDSCKSFLLYVYPLFLGWYVYDKQIKHLPLSLPHKQGKCSLFTFLHIDNFAKPRYAPTFTWFEIFFHAYVVLPNWYVIENL